LVFDLEDSVLPREKKYDARKNILHKVSSNYFKHTQLFVRINDRESGFLLEDIHTLCIENITGFVYPKTRNGEDIFFVDRLLETIEYEKGFPIGKFKIIPIIENSASVLNAQEICQSSKRVIALAFGSADFMNDLQGELDDERLSLHVPRAMIALAARSEGVYPIDTSFNYVHDLEGLEYNLKIAKKLGFEGMSVLHPKQIELAHKYFSPSEEEIIYANELLILNEEAIKESKGVAIKEGKFIGPPLIDAAKNLLKKHQKIANKLN